MPPGFGCGGYQVRHCRCGPLYCRACRSPDGRLHPSRPARATDRQGNMPKIIFLPHETLCPEGLLSMQPAVKPSSMWRCGTISRSNMPAKSPAPALPAIVSREGFDSLEPSDELEDDMLDKAWFGAGISTQLPSSGCRCRSGGRYSQIHHQSGFPNATRLRDSARCRCSHQAGSGSAKPHKLKAMPLRRGLLHSSLLFLKKDCQPYVRYYESHACRSSRRCPMGDKALIAGTRAALPSIWLVVKPNVYARSSALAVVFDSQGIKQIALVGSDWDLERRYAFYQGFYTLARAKVCIWVIWLLLNSGSRMRCSKSRVGSASSPMPRRMSCIRKPWQSKRRPLSASRLRSDQFRDHQWRSSIDQGHIGIHRGSRQRALRLTGIGL